MTLRIIILLLSSFLFFNNYFSQNKKYQKETFKVLGNCGMCKSKIENTAQSLEGVKYAKWDNNKKIIKVKFQKNLIDLASIQNSIAAVGYDTELYRASDEVYDKLHYCCKYDRE